MLKDKARLLARFNVLCPLSTMALASWLMKLLAAPRRAGGKPTELPGKGFVALTARQARHFCLGQTPAREGPAH